MLRRSGISRPAVLCATVLLPIDIHSRSIRLVQSPSERLVKLLNLILVSPNWLIGKFKKKAYS